MLQGLANSLLLLISVFCHICIFHLLRSANTNHFIYGYIMKNRSLWHVWKKKTPSHTSIMIVSHDKNVCIEASLFFFFSGTNEQLVKKVLKEVHISSKPCLYNFWLKSKTASWFWIQQLRLNKFSFCDIKVGNTNDMNDFAFSLKMMLLEYCYRFILLQVICMLFFY